MKVNREIRAPQVRVISADGKQLGLFTLSEALRRADEVGLDLVEIAPKASPPVCKIIDYGKLRYQQTKKERGQRKSQQTQKVKEVKFKPNIDSHDLQVKVKRARDFLEKGYKVKFTCMFRGREIVFVDNGRKVMEKITEELSSVATTDGPARMMGRMLSLLFMPGGKEKKPKIEESSSESES